VAGAIVVLGRAGQPVSAAALVGSVAGAIVVLGARRAA
jgi:hypothetical protein